jgi:hypothetical protein
MNKVWIHALAPFKLMEKIWDSWEEAYWEVIKEIKEEQESDDE